MKFYTHDVPNKKWRNMLKGADSTMHNGRARVADLEDGTIPTNSEASFPMKITHIMRLSTVLLLRFSCAWCSGFAPINHNNISELTHQRRNLGLRFIFRTSTNTRICIFYCCGYALLSLLKPIAKEEFSGIRFLLIKHFFGLNFSIIQECKLQFKYKILKKWTDNICICLKRARDTFLRVAETVSSWIFQRKCHADASCTLQWCPPLSRLRHFNCLHSSRVRCDLVFIWPDTHLPFCCPALFVHKDSSSAPCEFPRSSRRGFLLLLRLFAIFCIQTRVQDVCTFSQLGWTNKRTDGWMGASL